MAGIKWLLVALLSWVILLACCTGSSEDRDRSEPSPLASSVSEDAEILQYRTWHQATPEPVLVAPRLSTLCVSTMTAADAMRTQEPYGGKYIVVFVNARGKQAMLEDHPFPEGSRIVKEKRPSANGPAELATFMVKREKGFNPKCGDWEFGVIEPNPARVVARGKLANCESCHVQVPKQDFVFRKYGEAEPPSQG